MMPLYFMHLRDHVDEVLDPEGIEYRDFEALKRAAIVAARDVMSGDIRNGIIDLRYRIDAENEGGKTVYTLPFSAAVRVIPNCEPVVE